MNKEISAERLAEIEQKHYFIRKIVTEHREREISALQDYVGTIVDELIGAYKAFNEPTMICESDSGIDHQSVQTAFREQRIAHEAQITALEADKDALIDERNALLAEKESMVRVIKTIEADNDRYLERLSEADRLKRTVDEYRKGDSECSLLANKYYKENQQLKSDIANLKQSEESLADEVVKLKTERDELFYKCSDEIDKKPKLWAKICKLKRKIKAYKFVVASIKRNLICEACIDFSLNCLNNACRNYDKFKPDLKRFMEK